MYCGKGKQRWHIPKRKGLDHRFQKGPKAVFAVLSGETRTHVPE